MLMMVIGEDEANVAWHGGRDDPYRTCGADGDRTSLLSRAENDPMPYRNERDGVLASGPTDLYEPMVLRERSPKLSTAICYVLCVTLIRR